MRVEMLPGMTNVVRFPVERRARPTVELLREIAPDVRDVLTLAEHYGIEPPDPHLRAQSDVATAEWILNQVPSTGPGQHVHAESPHGDQLSIHSRSRRCRNRAIMAWTRQDQENDFRRTQSRYRATAGQIGRASCRERVSSPV